MKYHIVRYYDKFKVGFFDSFGLITLPEVFDSYWECLDFINKKDNL